MRPPLEGNRRQDPFYGRAARRQAKKRNAAAFLQELGLLCASDQFGLHLGLLQASLVFRQKRRLDGGLHPKSSRRVRPSLPARAYSDPDEHGQSPGLSKEEVLLSPMLPECR